ncbi:hypothetical protein NOM01_08560 [Sporolactobacillus sp. STSJ-5]|uniref:hypothetical protein n=1 Tax=Sporolactobacillus sp. STSJ-5 TaxID=2965076 RepID=UPI0021031DF1|nr:hypothetical protein [Sporolactobacillus sp. STSJ-5]MCQ2010061.1 hypothetical protein [Sporolactobacillus sp. STSJ-5]
MYGRLKNYWHPFVEENRGQIIVFALFAPVLVAVPALTAVTMIHGSFLSLLFHSLLEVLFLSLFAVLPLFLLLISTAWPRRTTVFWCVFSGACLILWFIIFQVVKFYS